MKPRFEQITVLPRILSYCIAVAYGMPRPAPLVLIMRVR